MRIRPGRAVQRIGEPVARRVRSQGAWRSRGLRRVLLVGLLASVVGSMLACSEPDREILAGLDEAEQARFRNGRQAAVPCWTCHDLKGEVKKVGPSLRGVYGRMSGRAPDYAASAALRAASIVWDDRSLAAFLSDPAGFVPGNRMVSPPVRDPRTLADLLFYLRRVSASDTAPARDSAGRDR